MKLYNIKYISLLALLLGSAFLFSCDDDELQGSSELELLSFGPAGVEHGDTIVFIGSRLDEITSLVFSPDIEVPSNSFLTQGSSQFTVEVPDAAEAGHVMLMTADGDSIVSKTILNFEVPVEVDDITTAVRPGATLTITGDKINWIETVTFSDDLTVAQEDFVMQSATELVVTVPMEAETGFLIFTTGGTEPLTFGTEEELIVTVPVITALNPTSIRQTADLTIEGTDLDLVTELVLMEGVSILKSDFKSQSTSEIVVTVPADVVSGTITLNQLSPIEIVSVEELTIVLPIGESLSPSPAIPGTDNATIVGTDLDLVGSITFNGADPVLAANFVSQTATEIVVAIPESAAQGGLSYETIHGYEGSLGVLLILPGDGPDPLLVPVFDEGVEATVGTGGGFGGAVSDFANTERARVGTISAKITYVGSYGGGAQFGTWGKDDLDVSAADVFAFSIYGGSGTDGESINVGLNGSATVLVTITEGEWTDVEIPMTEFGALTAVTEIWFQDQGWSGDIYLDRIGFGAASGPATLDITLYDDATASIVGEGGGFGGATSDFANTEEARVGSNAVKVTYVGGYGAGCQFGTWGQDDLDVSLAQSFVFSVYGGIGTGGQSLNVGLNGSETTLVTIAEAEWTDVEIPMSELGSLTAVTEVWFQDQDWSGDIYLDNIGFIY